MENSNIFDLKGAAAYLGLKPTSVKHHIYVTKTLRPDGKIGKSLIFTRSTLDAFMAIKRVAGRPRIAPHQS